MQEIEKLVPFYYSHHVHIICVYIMSNIIWVRQNEFTYTIAAMLFAPYSFLYFGATLKMKDQMKDKKDINVKTTIANIKNDNNNRNWVLTKRQNYVFAKKSSVWWREINFTPSAWLWNLFVCPNLLQLFNLSWLSSCIDCCLLLSPFYFVVCLQIYMLFIYTIQLE